MNGKQILIRKLMLSKFERDHNAAEEPQNICCAKVDGAVDDRTVIRYFKKFREGCKSLTDQARSDWPKTENSKAVLQTSQREYQGR